MRLNDLGTIRRALEISRLVSGSAALMMQLGADGVFVGSGIFKSSNPEVRAKAIVKATTHFRNPEIIAEVSKNLGDEVAMRGLRSQRVRSRNERFGV